MNRRDFMKGVGAGLFSLFGMDQEKSEYVPSAAENAWTDFGVLLELCGWSPFETGNERVVRGVDQMGIAELAASVARKAAPPTGPATAALRSRQLWREVFGRGPQMVNKEDPRPYGSPAPTPGGTYARSIAASGEASFKRLLQAMRSMAPGGWSDDRWSQTNAYTGMAYVAIHGKCRIKSQAEFQVFKKDPANPDGKRPIREDEPGYELVKLLERPNPQDSFGDLMFRWGQQTDLTGMALTWMVPNKLGTPMELYPIPTAIAIPQPAVNPDYPDGYWRIQPVYPYGPFSTYPTPSSAVGAAIPAQWMLRFLEPHPMLRYDGYSPMSGMRLHIDEINMMDRSRHYSMRRATNPSAVLDLSGMDDAQPLNDDAIDRMLAEFANTMQGPENAGSLLIPPPGGKIEPWGAAPVDMDYQSGWDQLASFILGGFGITKPAAGMVEDSSYASLYATLKQLHLVTLQPECDVIAAQLTRHLAPFFGDDLIVEIRCKRVDDHDVKANKLGQLIQAKAITKNELRKELDMPLTEEEWGEEIAGTEKQEGGMPGMPGMPAPGGEGGNPMEGLMNAAQKEPKEPQEPKSPEEKERPRTEELGQGSRGPRDHEARMVLPKSLHKRAKHLLNGHSNGHSNGVATLPAKNTKSLYDEIREKLS